MSANDIKKLRELYQKRLLVPFIGAGLSAPFKIPTWERLIRGLSDEKLPDDIKPTVDRYLKKKDYWKAVDLVMDMAPLDEMNVQQFVVDMIIQNQGKPKSDELHNYSDLGQMNFNNYLTTNYDNWIYEYLSDNRMLPKILSKVDMSSQQMIHSENKRVWHLHGNISDPGTIVLSKGKYNELYTSEKYNRLLSLFTATCTLLFMGFSFDDQYIRELIKDHKEYFKGTHYILLDRPEEKVIQELKKDYGLCVMGYDTTKSDHVKEIRKFLDAIQQTSKKPGNDDIRQSVKALDPSPAYNISEALRINSMEYYKSLRSINGRFYHLNISDTILPGIGLIDTCVEIEGQCVQLYDGIKALGKEAGRHTVLTGEGGMGKTVSVITLWERFLEDKDSPIPLFIALNEYNEASTEERQDFIVKSICRNYLNKENFTGELKEKIWDLFREFDSKEGIKQPSVLLLLDGYNEITVSDSDQIPLKTELRRIIETARGVQIVITSRYDMRQSMGWTGFKKIDLLNLSDTQIQGYLEKENKPMPQGNLLELVRNPMMLTLYAATSEIMSQNFRNSEYRFKEGVSTGGEMLCNFIECQLVKAFKNNYSIENQSYYKFILRYFVPCIGYMMEQKGKFSISHQELMEEIEHIFRTHFDNKFYIAYPEFIDCKNILDKKDDTVSIFKEITTVLCRELMIMVAENNAYRFLHQNFRDYMAASCILNEVHTGVKTGTIPPVIKNAPISFYVRRYIGEIEGEHRNKPVLDSMNRWSIEHYRRTTLLEMLDMLRGQFREEQSDFATWNIIEILKAARGELTGCDLRRLDLSGLVLNGVRFYRGDISTDFSRSRLLSRSIFPQGHMDKVNKAVYSSDDKKVLSASYDKTIKEWSVDTGECIKTYTGHSSRVVSAVYSGDGKKILSASYDGSIRIWSVDSGKCIAIFNNIPGLLFHGCKFVNLHPGSDLTDDEIKILKLYGVQF